MFGEKTTVSKESHNTPRMHAWEGPWHEVQTRGTYPVSQASGLSPPGPSLSPPLRQWELARGEPTARVPLSAPEKDSGPGPMLSSAAEGRYHQHILATQPLMSAVEAEALETGQATVLRDSTRTLQAHRWILLSIGPADSSVGPAARTRRASPSGIHMGP